MEQRRERRVGTRRRRSRSVLLATSTALGVVVVLLAPVATGRADTRAARHQAWARTGQVPSFVAQADRIYVAVSPLGEEARAFVELDASGDRDDLAGAALVLTEADDGFLPDQATLSTCPLQAPLSTDGEVPVTSAPAADCTARIDASRDPDGTWTIELAPFASRWRGEATAGLAIFPDVSGGPSSYRVSFDATQTSIVGVAPRPSPAPRTTAASGAATATTFPVDGGFVDSAPLPDLSAFDPAVEDLAAPEVTEPVPSTPTGDAAPRRLLTAVRSAASPSAAVVLGPLLLVAVVAIALTRRYAPTPAMAAVSSSRAVVPTRAMAAVAATALLTLFPLLFTELSVYRIGLVLIFVVAAIGLHILVNWAGELSLAHAGMVGMPAFVVGAISERHDVNPLLLVPLGLVVGAAVGGVVALPALRAKGLQVALVTFAAGIAIDRFFFTKTWLVGPSGGRQAAVPRLGPWTFDSSRALYPVLALTFAAVVVATWGLFRSRVARALFWIKANPDAAAVFGVPVKAYRVLAYVLAGAFAGLAGSLTVVWIQRVSSFSFPLTLSFTYLVVVVIAGAGFVGGVAMMAATLEGGRLFSSGATTWLLYMGPVGLLVTLIVNQQGINGAGRQLMNRLRNAAQVVEPVVDVDPAGEPAGEPAHAPAERHPQRTLGRTVATGLGQLTWTLGIGIVALVAGFVAIVLAWYHAGNTRQLWIQNQEMISGGLGGIALVLVGAALLIRDRIARAQIALATQLEASLRMLVSQQQTSLAPTADLGGATRGQPLEVVAHEAAGGVEATPSAPRRRTPTRTRAVAKR